MPQYQYKAVDASGKTHSGIIHAVNELDIEHRLKRMQYDLVKYKVLKANRLRLGRSRLNRHDLINLVYQLEQLTRAGIPLLDGLKDLRDCSKASYYRDLLSTLIENIEGGKTFSEALKEFPKDFDLVFISLIEVGEASGELSNVLKNVGDSLRHLDELISRTVSIMIYPMIVGIVILGVATFIMTYLVPKIIPFIRDMGGELPLHTLVLINASNIFIDNWWVITIGPVFCFILLKKLIRKYPQLRFYADKYKLKIPLFGRMLFKAKLARFATYLALLYSSGITLISAFEICRSLIDNTYLKEEIRKIELNIKDGETITNSFDMSGIFPSLVVRMLRIGEHTGNMSESLLNISYFYNREVQEAIEKIEPSIQPIMTVLMAVLLGWVMFAVLGPIWDTISKIG